jgi:hypothetical protein
VSTSGTWRYGGRAWAFLMDAERRAKRDARALEEVRVCRC